MKIRVFPIRRLSNEHVQAWSEIQLASSEFDSPYFRPEYHQLAAEVGRPVHVGVMEQGDEPVGFFPFERGSFGTGWPVGLRISDFHGAIVKQGVQWSGLRLLAACGLKRFCFDHLLASQTPMITGPVAMEPSPVVDLPADFAAYRWQLRERGEKELEKVLKKQEKMTREIGPVQFNFHDSRPAAFDRCIAWKSSQYDRTHALNVFRMPWVVELLRRIASCERPHFAGCVSTLSVNESLLAVHIGMRTSKVLHHWFPAHDPDSPCVRFSPGLQLIAGMVDGACRLGLKRLDFGKGDFVYKRQLGTGASYVAEGICGGSRMSHALAGSWRGTKAWLRNTAETTRCTAPLNWYRQMRDWLAMR